MNNEVIDWIKEDSYKAVIGLVFSGFGAFAMWVKKKFKEQELVREGLQALLRNEIIQQIDWWMDKGYCPVYARDNISNMYDKYHGLGKNGVIDNLYETFMSLPTEKREING